MDNPEPNEEQHFNSGSQADASGQIDDFFPENDAEFSLNQLSEAYAEVIEAQTGVKHTVGVPNQSDAGERELGQAVVDDSVDDNAGCPISPESIVESILFVGAPRDVKLNSRKICLLYTSPSPRDLSTPRMPSSA